VAFRSTWNRVCQAQEYVVAGAWRSGTDRKVHGFRAFGVAEIALYHSLGKRPKPIVTHRFYWRAPARTRGAEPVGTQRHVHGQRICTLGDVQKRHQC
jgi:hypothetical protein